MSPPPPPSRRGPEDRGKPGRPARRKGPPERPSLAGGEITALRPVRNDPASVWVTVDGRRAGRIDRDTLDRCRAGVGSEWTAELEAAARSSESRSLAKSYALKALARRPLSRAELIDRIRARGHDEAAAAAVADDLQRAGLIDDAAFARQFIRARLDRKPAGRALLLAGLRRKRIDQTTAREAVDEALGGVDLVRQATLLAAKRLRTMRADLPADAVQRRLYGLLARRGFDPDTCRQAVGTAMKNAGRNTGGARGERGKGRGFTADGADPPYA